MGKGRSLELYFIDGKPDGMLTAEVFNWTGHVLMTPRTRIKDALGRGEAGYTGVYILLGETEDGPQAYIGEAEDLGTRLRGHVKGKDWWEVAVLITSTANNLHKAHVKYLESRLVEMALVTKRMPLENGNTPNRPSLSEAAEANMEEFLETLMMVLPAIQVDMFVNKTQPKDTLRVPADTSAHPIFELVNSKYGINANAVLINGEFVVKTGSIAGKEWTGTQKGLELYMRKHAELLNSGTLQIQGNKAVVTQDYAFPSPSQAAATISARYATRNAWKLKGTNTTYAEWEAAQLDQMDTQA